MDRRTFLVGLGAATLSVTSPSFARLRPPRILVTADAESHVAVVDPVAGRVVTRLRTIELPRSIERVRGVAVVGHSELGRVTLIDIATLDVRPLPARFGEPRYTAAHADDRFALVSDSKRGEVIVLDVVRGRVVARVEVGGAARHIATDRNGRRAWTALGTKAPEIAILDVADPRRPRLLRRIEPPFLAHDVVFAPDGRHIWVTSGDRGTIAIYDSSSREIVRRIAALAPPQHVTFSERGRVAYVASGDDGSLRTHGLDGRLLVSSNVPVGSFNVSRGGGHVFTPSLERGTLCVLDRSGRVRRTIAVGRAAHDACVA